MEQILSILPTLIIQDTCYEHLKNILFHITSNEINWNTDFLALSDEITKWLELKSQYLVWDKNQWRYNYK